MTSSFIGSSVELEDFTHGQTMQAASTASASSAAGQKMQDKVKQVKAEFLQTLEEVLKIDAEHPKLSSMDLATKQETLQKIRTLFRADYEQERTQAQLGILQELYRKYDASIKGAQQTTKVAKAALLLPKASTEVRKTRQEKVAISEKCLSLLKTVLGGRSLIHRSADLANLSNGGGELQRYQTFVGQMNPEQIRLRTNLHSEVKKLQTLLNNPNAIPGKDAQDKRKHLQEKLCKLLESDIYSVLKGYEIDPLVHFLHTAADIMHNHAEAMSSFEDLGQYLVKEPLSQDEYNYQELQELMKAAVDRSAEASAGSRWGFLHPKRAFDNWMSQNSKGHNASGAGNIYARLGAIQINGKRIGVTVGPNPASGGYPIYSAFLQRNENLAKFFGGNGPTHVQFALEGPQAPLPSQIKVSAKVNALPFDAPIAKKGQESVDAFLDEIHHLYQTKDHGGFFLHDIQVNYENPGSIEYGSPLLQFSKQTFRSAFGALEGTKGFLELQTSGRLTKALLLGFNAIVHLKSLEMQAEKVPEPVTIDGLTITSSCNSACKKGVDRGAVMNMAIRMLVDARAKGNFTLNKEQIYQYCGFTAGRARMVEARRIKEEEYDALDAFMTLFGKASDASVEAFFKGLDLPDMEFIPSHQE